MIDNCYNCGKKLDWSKVYINWTHVWIGGTNRTVACCQKCLDKAKNNNNKNVYEQLSLDI